MMRPRATEQDTIDSAEELLQLRLMKLKYDFDWSNINRDKRAAELLKLWLECIQGSASVSIPTVTHTVAARHPSDLEFNTRAVMMLAQGGHAEAQYKLAQFYLGRGQQDQAVSLLTSAARQGHMPAQFHLIRIFHSGLPDLPRNQEQAKSWVQILTRQLQEEYFETVSANETESTARRLEQFHKQVTDFLKSKPDLADETPLLLRAHPALDYLSSRGDVVRAVEALNKLLHAFQSHAIISESKWTIANICNNRRLRMDEQSHELLRPWLSFHFLWVANFLP